MGEVLGPIRRRTVVRNPEQEAEGRCREVGQAVRRPERVATGAQRRVQRGGVARVER
jgi:hypothetical protein